MSRYRKGLGFGLWTCANCTAFKQRTADDEETCEEYGLQGNHAPCSIDRSWFAGEFEPLDFGSNLTAAKPFTEVVKNLGRDEVKLAQYLIESRDWELIHQPSRPSTDFTVGLRVVVVAGGHSHTGTITKVGEMIDVKSDKGVPLKVHGGSVFPESEVKTGDRKQNSAR